MPALIQVCIVIVTIGMAVIAIAAVRTMARVDKAADELSRTACSVRESLVRVDRVAEEARELAVSVHACFPPVQRVLDRIDSLSRRTAGLASVVLEEVERPVFTAAAVARGARTGARRFLELAWHRFTHRNASIQGGNNHE
ncbi:MAG TPA: hypothetical protein VLT84_02040 [Acidobacteriota bacterium]|nr:hypothetical protein [Acidobacteriota bacterium]